MAWEDDDVEIVNSYEGATFKERYDNAFKDDDSLVKFGIAKKFNDNIVIKKNNTDKEIVESYAGSTPQKKYNKAKLDDPTIGEFNVLYPTIGKSKEEKQFNLDKPVESATTFNLNRKLPNGDEVNLYSEEAGVENMDNASTVSTLNEEMTPAERLKQFGNISQMEFADTMTREQLEEAGIDEKVITKLEQEEIVQPPNAGDVFLDPLSIIAENKLAEPVMKVLGSLAKPVLDEIRQFGVPRKIRVAMEQGDTEALKRYAKTIEELKGMKLGDEIFTGGGSLANNIFEQRKYYETVLAGVKAKTRAGLNKVFPNSANLADDMKTTFKGMEDVLFKETQSKYDDVVTASSDLTYPVKQMKEDILNELKERGIPSEVYGEVKRNLEYIGRNLTPQQDVASKLLTGIDTKLTKVGAKLKAEKFTNNSIEKELVEATRKQAEFKKLLSNKDTVDSVDLNDVKQVTKDITRLTAEKGVQNKKVVALTNTKRGLTTKREGYKSQLPDTDYVSEKEFMRMIKRFNEKTRTGGNLSTADKQVTSSLQLAKKRTQEAFESATKEHNPEVYTKFMEAQNKYKDYSDVFGKKSDIGGVLDNNNIDEAFDTIMNSQTKVAKFTRLLRQKDPELAKEFANKYITKQIGAVKEGTRDMFDAKGIDLDGISGKLDNIINNPETKQFIIDNVGQAKFDEIETMFNVTSGLQKVMDKIGYKGKLDEGFWQYFNDANGVMNKMGRSLRYVVDGVRGMGADIGKSDKTLAEIIKDNGGDKILKSMTQRATPAVKKMLTTPYSSNWFTGSKPQSQDLMNKTLGLIDDKLSGRVSAKKEFWDESMGSSLNEFAEEEDLYNESNKQLANQLIAAGMTPILVMKTLGLSKVSLAGILADNEISKGSARRTMRDAEDAQVREQQGLSPKVKNKNILDYLGDFFN